jgi:hypothetical protein
MDHPRRERIRELIQTLGSVRDQVHDIWIEEEGAFERRSAPSKETVSGGRSSDAFYNLEEATHSIQAAIEHMQSAVGDDAH